MTTHSKLTVWDCMFGDSKWIDYFNQSKHKNDNTDVYPCLFQESANRQKGQNGLSPKSVPGSCCNTWKIKKDSKTSLHVETKKTDVKVTKDKGIGCKIELLWALKCRACKKHHACHCRYKPVVRSKQSEVSEWEKQARTVCNTLKKLEMEKLALHEQLLQETELRKNIMKKEQEDNEKLQTVIEERNTLLSDMDEKKKKLLHEIETGFDTMDSKITGVENLIRCLESYKHLLIGSTGDGQYKLVRSDSHPSVLCIRPPINNHYCIDSTARDCVRMIPDGEDIVIHGKQFVNEDDTITVCNILSQILDQNVMEIGLVNTLMKIFKCFIPFSTEIEDVIENQPSIVFKKQAEKLDKINIGPEKSGNNMESKLESNLSVTQKGVLSESSIYIKISPKKETAGQSSNKNNDRSKFSGIAVNDENVHVGISSSNFSEIFTNV